MPRAVALALFAVALMLVSDAAANPPVWATVNICDTTAAPDAMGVRASMAGTGRPRRMYVRFDAQYFSDGWRRVTDAASPWIYLGLVRRRAEQAGWTFSFDKLEPGQDFRLRGTVDFQWRVRKRGKARRTRLVVVKRRRAVTRAGLTGVDSGDPPETSLASCLIVGGALP